MKKNNLLLLILFPLMVFSQLPSFNWGGQIGGQGSEDVYTSTTDIFGNVIVAGLYNDTADFDLDASTTNNLLSSGNVDQFISKYDPDGNLLWAKSIDGTSTPYLPSITELVSDSSGNIYIVGYFEETIDVNLSDSESQILTSNGDEDIFILKLDRNGNYIWSGAIGGIEQDRANAIAIDNQDNLYLTGFFESTVDFDFSENEMNLDGGESISVFILKIDKDSNLIWAKSLDGGFDQGKSITVDQSYEVYITGHISSSTDFDPGPNLFNLTASGGARALFVLKLDENGDFMNAGVTASLNSGSIPDSNTIKLDNNNDVYVSGAFSGTVDFDLSDASNNLVSFGSSAFDDIFVLKLDNDLNFLWAKNMGGAVNDSALSMDIDSNNNIYTTGFYQGGISSDFDPGPGYNPLISNDVDAFISILNSDGLFVDAKRIAGSGNNYARTITLDNEGNVYIAGFFRFNISIPELDTFGFTDGFLFKYGNIVNTPPSNFPPIALDDNITVLQGNSEIIDVTVNDIDADGMILHTSISITSPPISGEIINNGDGTLTYTHDGSTNLNDSFKYTVEDNNNATSNVATVNITTTLGVQNVNLKNLLKIYPNPTEAIFYIDSTIEISKIEIYNMMGVKLNEYNEVQKINISNISTGTYILKLKNSTNKDFYKIIVKK